MKDKWLAAPSLAFLQSSGFVSIFGGGRGGGVEGVERNWFVLFPSIVSCVQDSQRHYNSRHFLTWVRLDG